ncbi:MAG: cytochrome c peroxidase [Candidatus Kapaibacterium sp.]
MKHQRTLLLVLTTTLSLFAISCQDTFHPAFATNETDNELYALLRGEANGKGVDFFIMPSSEELAKIPQDPRNPITPAKVALGQMLFHETGMGVNSKHTECKQTYSCASCHHVAAGFQAGVAQGIGDGGDGFGTNGDKRISNKVYTDTEIDVQPIRSPSAMNMAYQPNILWNGQFGATNLNIGTQFSWAVNTPKFKNYLGYEGLETQAIAGQDVHRLGLDTVLIRNNETYKKLFDEAYPELPENKRITTVNAGLAIAAYERTLFASKSPWQSYLKGSSNAMSEDEKKGAILFFGKGKCGSCHTGPALSSMEFHAFGMNDLTTGTYGAKNVNTNDAAHKGRGGFTFKDEDMFRFKVPQLYNLADSKFYGHGSSFTSVRAVVEYKNKGVAQNSKVDAKYLSPYFKPLGLTDNEVDLITLFIEKSLYDADLKRYVPTSIPTKKCFPNDDQQTRTDLHFKP